MSHKSRKYNQDLFGNVNRMHENYVIVATSAFGLGIDIADVGVIINYDIPSSMSELIQQLGRAGRNNMDTLAITLFSYEDYKRYVYQ